MSIERQGYAVFSIAANWGLLACPQKRRAYYS